MWLRRLRRAIVIGSPHPIVAEGVFFANAYVDGTQSFEYDPIYRLISATGREHAAPISHPQDSTARTPTPRPTVTTPSATSSA